MAKAPIYQPGQVKRQNLPSVRISTRATPASFGGARAEQIGAFGASLSQVSAVATNLTIQSQEKKNRTLARDYYNQASRELNNWLTTDLYGREGEEALDAYDVAAKKVEEFRKKYVAKLKNNRQQELFNASYDSLSAGHLNRAIGFQEQQRSKHELNTIAAENLLEIETAVDNRTDPEAVKAAEKTILINTLYVNKGASPEVKEKAVAEANNTLYNSVLDALINDSPGAAFSFYQINKDKFSPIMQVKLEAELKELTEAETVRNAATVISNSGLSIEDQLAEVDKIKDADIAAKVRSQVKNRNNEKALISKANAKQLLDDEWTRLLQNPRQYDIPQSLPANVQKDMRTFQDQAAKEWAFERGVGPGAVTDWLLYNDLMSMSDEEFAKEDMTEHITSFTPVHYKQLVDRQRGARFPTGSAKKNKATRVRTIQQQAKAAISGMADFDTRTRKGKRKKEDEVLDATERTNRYYEQLADALATIPEEEQTEERLGRLTDHLLSPVTIRRGIKFTPFIPGTPFHKIPYPSLGDKIYRFEMPYLEDIKEKQKAFKQNIPQNLKAYLDVKFDDDAEIYYVEGDDITKFYDLAGTYLYSEKRIR